MQERFKDMHQRLDNAYASLVEMIKVNSSSLPEVDGKFVRSILPMSTDEATKSCRVLHQAQDRQTTC